VDEQTMMAIKPIVQLSDPIQLFMGIVMWLQIKQVPERAIAAFPEPVVESR